MGIWDKAKDAAGKAKEVAGKAKDATKQYTDNLSSEENKIKELRTAPMEERVASRPEGVKYCLVNNMGKILDVYDNKVVFTSSKSTSTVMSGLVFGQSVAQGEKTIYFKDALGVQYKPSSVLDGFIQVETAVGGMTSTGSQYGGENSISFSGKEANEDAEVIVDFIKKQIENIKNAPTGGAVQQISSADELKKFKELLDMGVISQEEFDAKKKQLLGL